MNITKSKLKQIIKEEMKDVKQQAAVEAIEDVFEKKELSRKIKKQQILENFNRLNETTATVSTGVGEGGPQLSVDMITGPWAALSAVTSVVAVVAVTAAIGSAAMAGGPATALIFMIFDTIQTGMIISGALAGINSLSKLLGVNLKLPKWLRVFLNRFKKDPVQELEEKIPQMIEEMVSNFNLPPEVAKKTVEIFYNAVKNDPTCQLLTEKLTEASNAGDKKMSAQIASQFADAVAQVGRNLIEDLNAQAGVVSGSTEEPRQLIGVVMDKYDIPEEEAMVLISGANV